MTTRDDVARWRALADAATPGTWVTCEANHGDCTCGLVWSQPADVQVAMAGHGDYPIPHEAMIAVRDFIAASREAVPAMADALVEAAHIIDALLGTGRGNAAEAEAVAWLAEWRGDAPGGGGA